MGLVPNMGFVVTLFSHDITIWERTGSDSVDDWGEVVEAASASRVIQAHCFPTPGNVLRAVDIGLEGMDSATLRTEEELEVGSHQTAVETGGAATVTGGDSFIWNGREYAIFQDASRTAGAGVRSFGEYLGLRVARNLEAP